MSCEVVTYCQLTPTISIYWNRIPLTQSFSTASALRWAQRANLDLESWNGKGGRPMASIGVRAKGPRKGGVNFPVQQGITGNPIGLTDPSGTPIVYPGMIWPGIDIPSPGEIWDWVTGYTYPDKKPGKRACNAKCYGTPTTCPARHCPPTYGYGVGNTIREAVSAAKKRSTECARRGMQSKTLWSQMQGAKRREGQCRGAVAPVIAS